MIPKVEHEDLLVHHPRYLVVPKVEILTGLLYFLACLRVLRRIRKQFRFDALHVHWAYPDGFAGSMLSVVFKVPVVITAHGSDIYTYSKYPGVRWLLKWGLRKANSVVAVSNALRSEIKAMRLDHPVEVIPCAAVDPERFKIINLRQCRKELGLPEENKIILFVGNLLPVKGIKYLIEALAGLKTSGVQNVLLVLVGDGSEHAALRDTVRNLGLESSVLFAGRRPHQEIPLWMNSADVFCLPSLSEGTPNVIMEAMACGKPVVGTQVGGVPDVIRPDSTGYIVSPADSTALSKALEKALSSVWNHVYISEIAKQVTWDSLAQKYFHLFQAILSNEKERTRQEKS